MRNPADEISRLLAIYPDMPIVKILGSEAQKSVTDIFIEAADKHIKAAYESIDYWFNRERHFEILISCEKSV